MIIFLNKRPLDACPDQSRGNMAKLTNINAKKNQTTAIFWEKAQLVPTVVKTYPKSHFSFATP